MTEKRLQHTPAAPKVYSINNPLLMEIDDFLPSDILEDLENDIEKLCKFHKSGVVGADGKTAMSRLRTSQSANSIHYLQSEAVRFFMDAASTALRLHPAQSEPVQIVKYDMGEQYEPHHDTFAEDTLQENTPAAGNRIATALLYLNDVQDGGETDFPNMGITIEPKRGRCIFFSTTHMGTEQQLDLSYHGALPVIRGQKMAINMWFRRGIYDNDLYQKWLEHEQK